MENPLSRHNYNAACERLTSSTMNAPHPVAYRRMIVETGNLAEFDKNESTKNTVPMTSEAANEMLLTLFVMVQLYAAENNQSPRQAI